MPLFFCITGFLAYGNYDLNLFKKRFSNRIKKQLIPTMVVFVLYMAITKESFIQGLYKGIIDDSKDGYWFTYSLVQVWTIYAIISLIFHKYQINERFQLLCFSLFVIVLLPLKYIIPIFCPSFLETNISNILSLKHDIALMPFFFLGIIIRIVYPMIDKFMEMAMSKSKAIYVWGSILLSISLLLVFYKLSTLWDPISYRSSEIAGVLIIFLIFTFLKNFWSGDSNIASYICSLGKNTLPIYLFHYFILYFISANHLLDWMVVYVGNSVIEIPVLLTISIPIAHLCMKFDKFIKKINYVNRYVFGNSHG